MNLYSYYVHLLQQIRIHAILYVIASGRMGMGERNFMKEIIEILKKRYSGCEKRLGEQIHQGPHHGGSGPCPPRGCHVAGCRPIPAVAHGWPENHGIP